MVGAWCSYHVCVVFVRYLYGVCTASVPGYGSVIRSIHGNGSMLQLILNGVRVIVDLAKY